MHQDQTGYKGRWTSAVGSRKDLVQDGGLGNKVEILIPVLLDHGHPSHDSLRPTHGGCCIATRLLHFASAEQSSSVSSVLYLVLHKAQAPQGLELLELQVVFYRRLTVWNSGCSRTQSPGAQRVYRPVVRCCFISQLQLQQVTTSCDERAAFYLVRVQQWRIFTDRRSIQPARARMTLVTC